MTTYIARSIETIKNGHAWDTHRIGVFQVETEPDETYAIERKVGDYLFWYDGTPPFFHFQQDGKDYALYADHYTYTSVMELPSCKKIAVEDKAAHGFCPAQFYVPTWENEAWTVMGEPYTSDPKPLHTPEGWASWKTNTPMPTETIGEYYLARDNEIKAFSGRHGFVAGCLWGDDLSWKIQYLDLSRITDGIITREERFGYIELPANVALKDAFEFWDEPLGIFNLAVSRRFNITKPEPRT